MKRLIFLVLLSGGSRPRPIRAVRRDHPERHHPRRQRQSAIRGRHRHQERLHRRDRRPVAGHGARMRSTRAGLFVAPGFINIHSHASPDALPTAVNMLTQGVTTEIFNADGGGPLDLAQQMTRLGGAGTGREHRRLHRLQRRLADRCRQRRSASDAGRDRADARDDHRAASIKARGACRRASTTSRATSRAPKK